MRLIKRALPWPRVLYSTQTHWQFVQWVVRCHLYNLLYSFTYWTCFTKHQLLHWAKHNTHFMKYIYHYYYIYCYYYHRNVLHYSCVASYYSHLYFIIVMIVYYLVLCFPSWQEVYWVLMTEKMPLDLLAFVMTLYLSMWFCCLRVVFDAQIVAICPPIPTHVWESVLLIVTLRTRTQCLVLRSSMHVCEALRRPVNLLCFYYHYYYYYD